MAQCTVLVLALVGLLLLATSTHAVAAGDPDLSGSMTELLTRMVQHYKAHNQSLEGFNATQVARQISAARGANATSTLTPEKATSKLLSCSSASSGCSCSCPKSMYLAQLGSTPSCSTRGMCNGCSKVPDTGLLGSFNFTSCCNSHDLCYSTCGNPKKRCDSQLKACTDAWCAKQYPGAKWSLRRSVCYGVSSIYYTGLSSLSAACSAYTAAMTSLCTCSSSKGRLL